MTSPVSPFSPGFVNRVEIVPFTYRDGSTYLEILREMSKYLVGISTTFTDVLNATIENNKLIDEKIVEFTAFIDLKTAEIDAKIVEVEAMIEASKEYTDTQIAAMTELLNSTIADFNTRFDSLAGEVAALGIEIEGVSQALNTLSADLPNIIATQIATNGTDANSNVMSVVKAQIDGNKNDTDDAIDVATARNINKTSPVSASRQAVLDAIGGEVGGTPASQQEVNDNVDVNKYLTPRTANGFVDYLRENKVKPSASIDIPASFDIQTLSAPTGAKLTVPVPGSPTGGEVTHPSIVYSPESFGGYRYWMAYTPYAGGSDALEDPCIAASQDGVTWVVPTGLTNPLDDAPGGTVFNSDTALVFGDSGYLYCFWRQVNNTLSTETIYYRRSRDGVNWGAKTISRTASFATNRLVSPAYHYENGLWTMWAVNIQPAARPVVILTATGEPTGWSAPINCTVPAKATRDNWHIEVREFGGKYWGILADCETGTNGVNGDIYLISSVDGITWTRANNVLVPRSQPGQHNAIYRSTFVPEIVGGVLCLRVFYAAWLNQSPSVWNLFRTLAVPAAPGVAEQKGTLPTVAVPAGTNVNHRLDFPTPFASTPFVDFYHDSSRLTIAVVEQSATSFVFACSNWTSQQASPGTLTWRAR